MKKQLSIFLFLLMLVGITNACGPEDVQPQPTQTVSQASRYYEYTGKDPWVQEMIAVLKKQEYAERLAGILEKRFGAAQWDIAAKGPAWNNRPQRNESAGNSENTKEDLFLPEVLVPLVKEGQERVNAFIGWRRLSDGMDLIRIFDRDVYENLSRNQKMEQQPRLIAGYLLAYEHLLYGRETLKFSDFEYRFEDTGVFISPSDFGWSCTVVKTYDSYTGRLIGEYWYNCEDYTVTITPGAEAIEPEPTNGSYEPIYYDPNYNNNPYYGSSGGGSSTDYSSDPASLGPENPIQGGGSLVIGSAYEAVVAGPTAPTLDAVEAYMQLMAAELMLHPHTQEVGQAIQGAAEDGNLTLPEKLNLAMRGREIYLTVQPNNFNIDVLSGAQHTQLAADAAFIDLYPEVKQQIQENGWPLSEEEWSALWEIFKPMLAEVFLEAIPGGGLTLAFRDIIQGASGGDVVVITAGIVGLIVEFYPPAKIFKAVRRAGKVIRTGFKVAKHAFRHLATVARALKKGLKLKFEAAVLKLTKNGNEVARIANNILEFNYSGFGGKITTNPDKTTTIIGKWQDPAGGGTKEIIESGISKSGKNKGGINALSETPPSHWDDDDIWENINEPWLKEATDGGDIIRVVSDPNKAANLYKNGQIANGLSFFGKEVEYLMSRGYTYDSRTFTFKK